MRTLAARLRVVPGHREVHERPRRHEHALREGDLQHVPGALAAQELRQVTSRGERPSWTRPRLLMLTE